MVCPQCSAIPGQLWIGVIGDWGMDGILGTCGIIAGEDGEEGEFQEEPAKRDGTGMAVVAVIVKLC
jgi:hypothetical protein